MAFLIAVDGPNSGKKYALTGEVCVIGRSYESDIYISDLNVSRSHARVVTENKLFVVEDLGSGNGTYVNGEQMQRHTLIDKDEIRVGGCSFRFREVTPKKEKKAWFPEVLTVMADSEQAAQSLEEVGLVAHKPEQLSAEELSNAGKATTEIGAELLQEVRQSLIAEAAGAGELKQTEPYLEKPRKAAAGAERMLEAMYAVADAIAEEMDLPKLLEAILDHLFNVFPQSERGFVLLVNPKSGQLIPEAVKQRRQGFGGGLQFSQTIVRDVMDGGHGIIRGDTYPPLSQGAGQEALKGLPTPPSGLPEKLPQAKSKEPKIGAPLTCRGESLGTITLEAATDSKSFSKEDLDLLSAIARQAAMAIANARTGKAMVARERMDADLVLAREIQKSFLPHKLPRFRELEVGTHYESALQVGGDFYDIIKLGPSRLGIVVGDISGKGVSAALLMAKMISDIRLLSVYHQSPAKILTLANTALHETGQDGMFATVLYVMLDLGHGTYTLSNAGHNPPVIVSNRFEGTCELEDATSVALGIIDGMEYEEKTFQLVPGDCVLLYTDGINEAMSREREEYGMERLRAAAANGPPGPRNLVQRLVADVSRFVRGAEQSDDQTLVCFGLTSDLSARPTDATLRG